MSLSRVPGAKFLLGSILPKPKLCHSLPTWHQALTTFFLVFRVGMCSFINLFQIASSRCRTWVHVFVWIVGVSLKTHAVTLGNALPIKKWLGVNRSSSSMSLLTCVKGLALTSFSVSITVVDKTYHVNFANPRCKRRAHFTI